MTFVPWLRDRHSYVERLCNSKSYLIVDTQTFERLEEPCDGAELALWASRTFAQEVVLPDVLGDPEQTLRLSCKALEALPPTLQVMFVPQANNLFQWEWCLRTFLDTYFKEQSESPVIGLSSLRKGDSLRPLKGSRVVMMNELHRRCLPMHLLGLSSVRIFLKWELPTALACGVRSIDSCAAFALGARGLRLTKDSPRVFLGDLSRYDRLDKAQLRLIQDNMDTLDQWVTQGGSS